MTETLTPQDYVILAKLVKETLVGKKEFDIAGVGLEDMANFQLWGCWKAGEKVLAKDNLLKKQAILSKDVEHAVVWARLAEEKNAEERWQKKIDWAIKKLTKLKVLNPSVDGLIEIREGLKIDG